MNPGVVLGTPAGEATKEARDIEPTNESARQLYGSRDQGQKADDQCQAGSMTGLAHVKSAAASNPAAGDSSMLLAKPGTDQGASNNSTLKDGDGDVAMES